MEHDYLIDPIDEFRTEVGLDLAHHRELDNLVIVAGHLLDHLAAEVRRHHDHRVLEVHSASLAICHAAIVKYLKQYVEYVRMGLLDFVEQDHGIGLAANRLGQIPALLIADITGGRANQPGYRVLFHELGHVDADQMILGIEQERSQRFAQLRLAHSGRPQKQEGTIRPVRVGKSRTRATDCIRYHPHRLVLADHALMQPRFHVQQFFTLALQHL